MSLFGATKADEERIRNALKSQGSLGADGLPNSQSTSSFAHSSAYETASERDSIEFGSRPSTSHNTTNIPNKDIKHDNNDDDTNSAVTITNTDKKDISKSLETIDNPAQGSASANRLNSPSTKTGDIASDEDDSNEEYVGSPDGDQLGLEGLHEELSRISRTNTLQRKISKAKDDLAHHTHTHDEEDDGVPLESLDWDSPQDPSNPQNWSKLKKWFITMTTAFVSLVVTLGSSLYTSGIEDMVARGMAGQTLAISGLTFYVLGLSFGPMIAAPISELYGRRIVYLVSFPISLIFSLGVGFSHHIREVLVLRFFAGMIGSPALAVCSGTISDMWGILDIEVAMSFFCMAPFAGPIIGPILGGFAVEAKSWKWAAWIDLFFGAALLPFLIFCPETYKPVLLASRAKKRGIKVQKKQISVTAVIKQVFQLYISKPGLMLAIEPIVLLFSIWSAFIFAVLFGFFEAYPVIFRGVYKMSLGVSGLPFIGIGIGLLCGMLVYLGLIKYVFWRNPERFFKDGVLIPPKPETRLLPAKIGAICLPIGLFWVGWSSRTNVHWMVPIVGGLPFGFGLILIFFSTITYFSLCYPPMSLASAIAANNFLRYILASVFPLFTVQMYENVHIGWASTIFAFIALAMVPIPWVFEYYGPKIRLTSRFGYAAIIKRKKEAEAKLQREAKELESLEKNLENVDKEVVENKV